MNAITRADALQALATAPFVVAVAILITAAVCWALWHESRPSDYVGIGEKARRGDA